MRNVKIMIAVAVAALSYVAPVDAQTYYVRQKMFGMRGASTSVKPGDSCTTAPYKIWESPWTFLSNVEGTYSENDIQRIGEVPNAPGYPGANAICEAAIKGSRRTGCVLLGQPATGLAIGVFMTVENRATTFYTDTNTDFALVATGITCVK